MGLAENDDGAWVKKGVTTLQKGGSNSEDGDDDDDGDEVDRIVVGERTSISTVHSPYIASSSKPAAPMSHEPQLAQLEASIAELKDEDLRSLKHQVNNIITMAGVAIQDVQDEIKTTTDEFKVTSTELQAFVKQSCENITQTTKVIMDSNRALRPNVMPWVYWFNTSWRKLLRQYDINLGPPSPLGHNA
ncbi:hypothetical protein CJ030_MR2G012392 [Morella rubra]|uniref:Uncharacterized protein n=1 Tax=Morella rubra TaxID=262757 RepID=A0A6A1WDR6_9ROSI|nr:hypothetical protein CJ030_MR2G012392 [Morella rubra]